MQSQLMCKKCNLLLKSLPEKEKNGNYLSIKELHLCKGPIWMWIRTRKLSDPNRPEVEDL